MGFWQRIADGEDGPARVITAAQHDQIRAKWSDTAIYQLEGILEQLGYTPDLVNRADRFFNDTLLPLLEKQYTAEKRADHIGASVEIAQAFYRESDALRTLYGDNENTRRVMSTIARCAVHSINSVFHLQGSASIPKEAYRQELTAAYFEKYLDIMR